jgi:hypothetical protein
MITQKNSGRFLYDYDSKVFSRKTNQNQASFFSKKQSSTNNLILKVRDGYVNEETSYLCKVAKKYSLGASVEVFSSSLLTQVDQKAISMPEQDINDDISLESLGNEDTEPFFPSSYFKR